MRPKLPPPPLPPNCVVVYVVQQPRRTRWDSPVGFPLTPTPIVFHCLREGEPGSLCGVRPDLNRRKLLKRATMWQPEKWSRQKFFSRARVGTVITCVRCAAIIRKDLRPKLRRRPAKPQPVAEIQPADQVTCDPIEEVTMPNFMSLPKRVAATPAAEIPVPVAVAPVVQPATPPAAVAEAPRRARRVGEPPSPENSPRAMYPSFLKLLPPRSRSFAEWREANGDQETK